MPSVYRVTQIECPFQKLEATDVCYHFGEYTSGGGHRASDTNRWILNLKWKPTSPQHLLKWKERAVEYWADILTQLLPPQNVNDNLTIVTIPGSKPEGHPDFDPRMEQVLRRWAHQNPQIDIRRLLVQTTERPAQHEAGVRSSSCELGATMAIDRTQLARPLAPIVLIVDDVITLGSSFKAAQSMIAPLQGVQTVQGLFLARTVWPNPFDDDDS